MKMNIVVNEKDKKLQKLNTYHKQTPATTTTIANPGYLNLLAFHH